MEPQNSPTAGPCCYLLLAGDPVLISSRTALKFPHPRMRTGHIWKATWHIHLDASASCYFLSIRASCLVEKSKHQKMGIFFPTPTAASQTIHHITAHQSCSFLSQQHKYKHSSIASPTQHVLDPRKHGSGLFCRLNSKPTLSSAAAKCGNQVEGEISMNKSNPEAEEEYSWKEMEKWVDKCKGREGVVELLECLEREAIMGDDEGRDPLDYNRRAHIFDKSSRVFQALKEKQTIPQPHQPY